MQVQPKIKTNIKFYRGLDNIEDKLYGFVTKVDGSWRGCRKHTEKKKIVFIDQSLVEGIVPNTLYKCSIRPMDKGDGFIAVSAELVKFKATVVTACDKGRFIINVKFGNQVITYDPQSKDPKKRDIQGIANSLRNRMDLANAIETAEDFINSACLMKRLNKIETTKSAQNA